MERVLALALLLVAVSAGAEDEPFEFFKEEARVITASRTPEPAARAAVAVDVVTAEDIKAYGFKNVWDALRYRVGVDVLDGSSIDGNRALVSIRGNNQEFVNELQVLIDGRSVYSPILGGVYWASLPVQMQDIERIEIVRGPNAVLYGSNSATGVINIITKRPASGSGAAVGTYGGSQATIGTSEAGTAGGFRLSHEYRSEGNDPTSNGVGYANNYLHSDKVNVRGEWKPDAKTGLEIMGGGSWLAVGIPGNAANPATAHNTDNFQSFHGTRALGRDSGLEVLLSRSESTINPISNTATQVNERTYQYDADAMHHFSWLDDAVKSNWGASWRFSGADTDQLFGSSPRQSNQIVRGYMHHSARVADPLTLVGGAAIEHSSSGGAQPAYQGAALYEPAPDQNLRLSYSLAPTIPELFSQHADYLLSPREEISGNLGVKPEMVTSYEAGWNGRFLDGALRPSITTYIMNIEDQYFNYVASPGVPTVISVNNSQTMHARGAELSTECELSRERAFFANYAWEKIADDKGPDAVGQDRSRSTPVHMLNVGGRALLAEGITASTVLGYKDNYHITSSRGTSLDAHRSFRLDARLAWAPHPGWEMFVAGSNLLQPYTVEYADGTANPRSVRGGFTAKFGR